jgi:hypothetical protein
MGVVDGLEMVEVEEDASKLEFVTPCERNCPREFLAQRAARQGAGECVPRRQRAKLEFAGHGLGEVNENGELRAVECPGLIVHRAERADRKSLR